MLQYEYSVFGQTYVGRRISFSNLASGDPSFARASVAFYYPGRRVLVHYNNSSAEKSVLETKPDAMSWIYLLLGAGLMSTGIYFAFRIYKTPKSKRRTALLKQ